jgi:two-component system sensor histidine kinase KdpD
VKLDVPDDLPLVPIDVVQIDQALTNLLENAAKFSPPRTSITIVIRRRDADLEVRITDQGPGIAAEDRERVFEPFVRGEGSSGAGAGLGLSITRAIIEAHGGRILIEGPPLGGNTVVLTLPIEG